jgi:hypothetical protein
MPEQALSWRARDSHASETARARGGGSEGQQESGIGQAPREVRSQGDRALDPGLAQVGELSAAHADTAHTAASVLNHRLA